MNPEPVASQSCDSLSTRAVCRSEWRWVIVATVIILALTCIPYLAGWRLSATSGLTFSGFVLGVEDGNSYLAKMGQGARGDWLFHIVYTSEPHDGVLFFTFHLLLGKVAALLPAVIGDLPLRMIWVYHLARLACAAVLLAVAYRFVAEFLPELALRRLAWLMISAGGGLGWLLLGLGLGDFQGYPPLDFILPEGFSFLTIFTLPHIALARALLAAGILVWWKAVRQARRPLEGMRAPLEWRGGLLAGLLWLGMGLIVPFYPVVAGAIVGATLVGRWLLEGRFPGRELLLSVLAGLVAAPIVLYSGWVFLTDPVMKGWAAQNLILSPPPFHYLAAYLVPGLFAAVGVAWIWRYSLCKHLPLVAWALVVPPLLYAPFNLQRRLIEGYQFPLYTLAALGAGRVFLARARSGPRKFPRHRRARLLACALLVLMFSTSLVLLAGSTMAVAAGQPPIFHLAEQVDMAAWLTRNAPEGALVLSDYSTGNFLPGWAPVRAYYGHGPETIDFLTKQRNVHQFYAVGTDDLWRQRFLTTHNVRYVVHSPAERALGDFEPAGVTYLVFVFEQDGWAVYEVADNAG